MRCSCPQCGTYMVQQERGAVSRCVCPSCLFDCTACMGSGQQIEKGKGIPLSLLTALGLDDEKPQK